MSLTILATGDIHIGRRPSRVAEEDAARWSCARMWEAMVEEAIRRRVDLVALSGDVVDHENRFFEATGPLERGLRRLAEEGIPVYAVAGNHDHDVLPRIVDVAGPECCLHLLGRNGRWESAVLQRRGEPLLHVHGWSFPAEHVATSPLADYHLPVDDYLPTLVLLHADLDAADSRYAPVSRAELAEHKVTLWLLGHNHAPRSIEEPGLAPILYPGSPQAMDPGEIGPHGPWLIEVNGPRAVDVTQIPMSKVYYDDERNVVVDLTGADDEQAVQRQLTRALGEYLARIVENHGHVEQVSVRVRLTGQTAACRRIAAIVQSLVDDFRPSADGVTLRVDRVTNDTRPPVDLSALAEKRDPPGRLARMMLALDGEHGDGQLDAEVGQLLREAHEKMAVAHRAAAYAAVSGEGEPGLEEAREVLRRQGMRLLESLREQERTP